MQAYVSCKHEGDKVIVFERAGLVFVFNFHPTKSFADYTIGVHEPGEYKVALNSDDKEFGGEERLDTSVSHFTKPEPYSERPHRMMVYTPCRTAVIYARGNYRDRKKYLKKLQSFRSTARYNYWFFVCFQCLEDISFSDAPRLPRCLNNVVAFVTTDFNFFFFINLFAAMNSYEFPER